MDDHQPIAPHAPLKSEDYHFEGPNMVFTRAFLLKRGFCCGSGCRHCPYETEPQHETPTKPLPR
jgi:hypothetical protein